MLCGPRDYLLWLSITPSRIRPTHSRRKSRSYHAEEIYQPSLLEELEAEKKNTRLHSLTLHIEQQVCVPDGVMFPDLSRVHSATGTDRVFYSTEDLKVEIDRIWERGRPSFAAARRCGLDFLVPE